MEQADYRAGGLSVHSRLEHQVTCSQFSAAIHHLTMLSLASLLWRWPFRVVYAYYEQYTTLAKQVRVLCCSINLELVCKRL